MSQKFGNLRSRMTTGPKKPATPAEQRQARLEQELRANLLKRKAQARSRRETSTSDVDGAADAPNPLPQGPRSD